MHYTAQGSFESVTPLFLDVSKSAFDSIQYAFYEVNVKVYVSQKLQLKFLQATENKKLRVVLDRYLKEFRR